MSIRLPVLAAIILSLPAVACVTRLNSHERSEIEFWSQVSATTEEAVRDLDDEGRAVLAETLPEARQEETWRGVLEILDERSVLVPLTDRVQTFVDREADASVRTDLVTSGGNRRLRDLILSSIDNALAEP